MRGVRLTLRCLGALFAGWQMTVFAEPSPALELKPVISPIACLVKPHGPPIYPKAFLVEGSGALVRARMVFFEPDSAPKVEIFYNSGHDSFSGIVRDHLKAYRLPCLAAGAPPVTASQEFDFTARDGRPVVWAPTRAEANVPDASKQVRNCVSFGEGKPWVPKRTMEKGEATTVLLGIRFGGVEQPPETQILFDGGDVRFANSVRDHVIKQYRMTCEPLGGFPVQSMQGFYLRLDGASSYRLRDVPLRDFVGSLKDVERNGQVFDFSTMACPFEVEVRLYRPYADNAVGEVGAADPNRREFVEWLKKATLGLKPDVARQLVGAETRITIPCGKLDLS